MDLYRVDLRWQLGVVFELERVLPDRLRQDELVLHRFHLDELVDVGVDVRVESEHAVWRLFVARVRDGEIELLEERVAPLAFLAQKVLVSGQ